MKKKNEPDDMYIGEPIYFNGKKYRMLNIKQPTYQERKKIERWYEFYYFLWMIGIAVIGYGSFFGLLSMILK